MTTTVRPGVTIRLQAREDHLRWQPFIRHGTVYKLMEKPMIQIDRGTNDSEFPLNKKNKHNLKISPQYRESQVNKKMKFQEYTI
jgi:hypothetical protein